MYRRVRASPERVAIAVAIVAPHGALLMWLLHLSSPQVSPESAPQTSTILELLERIETPAPSIRATKTRHLHSRARTARPELESQVRESSPADSARPRVPATVDWSTEAERAASAVAE